ncbi:MAG: helix-turn-helix domain-containing protein [Bacteroidaceae bacterium]|nr:helix-turn-helix domain-containing protein [Bacteroidaceae bacterium]
MNVKAVIKKHGLTITEVASRIGISRVTLMQNLQRNPTQKTLQRIAEAVGCEVADFYKEDESQDSVIGFVEINKKIHKVESVEDLKNLVNSLEDEQ